MAQVDEIINGIMANPRLAESRVFSGKVYKDEPIIRRGSQMESYLPQRYRDMKALAHASRRSPDYSAVSGTRLFYEQAHFMANWEDDFPYSGTFERYYPTYSQMNDAQLRGYFTWRTRVRAGQVEETSLSFAFVYCYELLNGVGGKTPLECFRLLKEFWFAYREFAPEMNRYLKYWLRDYAVYWNLPVGELEGVVDTTPEEAMILVRHTEAKLLAGRGDCGSNPAGAGQGSRSSAQPSPEQSNFDLAQLFDALCVLGGYRSDRSRFFSENRADAEKITAAVFSDLVQHCAKRRKVGLADSWFGTARATPHVMFDLAVFYRAEPHPDCLYRINEAHAYSCRGGQWSALRNYSKAPHVAEVHDIMQSIDRMMREAYGFAHPLQKRSLPKYIEKMIAQTIGAFLEEKRAEEARRVSIDFAALSGIRSRAAQTCESLLIDEERGAGVGFVTEAESAREDAKEAVDEGNPLSLTDEEISLLRTLLNGAAAPDVVDMLVDSINEKLFDLLGDTALEFGASGPQIIEDYREDLEGVLS